MAAHVTRQVSPRMGLALHSCHLRPKRIEQGPVPRVTHGALTWAPATQGTRPHEWLRHPVRCPSTITVLHGPWKKWLALSSSVGDRVEPAAGGVAG